MKNLPLFLFVLLALSLSGCEKIKTTLNPPVKPEGTIIAEVGDMYITLEQLDQEIAEMNALINKGAEPKKLTSEEKIAFLNEAIIPRYLFFIEAKALGMDKESKVREQLSNLEVRLVSGQFLTKEIENSTPSAKEIEDFYATYKDQFRPAEEKRIREILVNSESDAKEILIKLLEGEDFAALARERSQAESASKGGDLGFIAKGKRGEDFKKFDEIAFSANMDAGQISQIFKDKKGYYIIKVDGVRGGKTPALNDIWDQVKSLYTEVKQSQKIQALRERLAQKTKISVYKEKVK